MHAQIKVKLINTINVCHNYYVHDSLSILCMQTVMDCHKQSVNNDDTVYFVSYNRLIGSRCVILY